MRVGKQKANGGTGLLTSFASAREGNQDSDRQKQMSQENPKGGDALSSSGKVARVVDELRREIRYLLPFLLLLRNEGELCIASFEVETGFEGRARES